MKVEFSCNINLKDGVNKLAFYSDDFIDNVRNSNDIVEVVSEYVKLKKSGKNYFGLCPFHSEKTPSFSVAPDKQIFYCFGCGAGGNVTTFISKVENLDFVESLKFLAERAKIPIPEFNNQNWNNNQRLKDDIYAINTESAKYFRNMLNSNQGKSGREYLEKRSMSTNIIQKFGIGFAHGLKNDLTAHLLKQGFSSSAILQSGVATKRDDGSIADRFKMRVMYPIFDIRGRVIAFGGRVLDDKLPKYLNSPETKVFSKGHNLYCMNFAKNSKEKTAIIVEGYMDAIALYQKGMDNVVASLGTALTENQARLLGKYFEEVAISYDADTAGQMATLRGLDVVTHVGLPVKVIRIEGAKDPDELVKSKGVQAFKNFVDKAKDLPEFKIDLLRKDYDLSDNRQKINFVNKVAGVLAEIENSIERDLYEKKVSVETGIGVDAIQAEVKKILYKEENSLKPISKRNVNMTSLDENNKLIDKKTINAERQIIALLSLNDEKSTEIIKSNINADNIKDAVIKNIYNVIINLYNRTNNIVVADVMNFLENDNEKMLYADILQKEVIDSDNVKLANQLVINIKKEKLELKKQEILKKLTSNELHKEEQESLDNELAMITVELKMLK